MNYTFSRGLAKIPNIGTPEEAVGYIGISRSPEPYEGTVTGYAYEDTAAGAIHTRPLPLPQEAEGGGGPPIPEPGTLWTLALGAAGLWRRVRFIAPVDGHNPTGVVLLTVQFRQVHWIIQAPIHAELSQLILGTLGRFFVGGHRCFPPFSLN